ncbi:hypothetical protein JMJ35_002859 [Cladonia borealis]|uniref:Uncharacterized protein n=1 Tax=Cladonia borealis TaxID=184061 RepID=A0AA39V3A8_9LECA|nr:hypothetical protein JMJ35_002859 [Cladonia borealis]
MTKNPPGLLASSSATTALQRRLASTNRKRLSSLKDGIASYQTYQMQSIREIWSCWRAELLHGFTLRDVLRRFTLSAVEDLVGTFDKSLGELVGAMWLKPDRVFSLLEQVGAWSLGSLDFCFVVSSR